MEAILSAVILSATITVVALLASRQWAASRDAGVLDLVENAVATDLGWLKNYGKLWLLSSGPYNLTASQTGASAYTLSASTIAYEPDEVDCATVSALANDFVAAANSVTLTPARPFSPVAVGDTRLSVGGLPSTIELWRTLSTTPPAGSSARNMVYLSYTLRGSGASSYRFVREAMVRPEVTSWCP